MLMAQFAHFLDFDEERKQECDADVEAELCELTDLVKRMLNDAFDDEAQDAELERPARMKVG